MASPSTFANRPSVAARLARDCTDLDLRGSLLKLAEEYAARAGAQENEDTAAWLPAQTTRTTDWLAAIGVGCSH
jgi:hypothetical protein